MAPHHEVRPSINLLFIRHAESYNNEVYFNARQIYKAGTPQFDPDGWANYVDKHRSPDPTIGKRGVRQARLLSDYLTPRLRNQASRPVRFIVSPQRRTLDTIIPTLRDLEAGVEDGDGQHDGGAKCDVIVNAFYHESEGCHDRGEPQAGMTPDEISCHIQNTAKLPSSSISCHGFSSPQSGWYADGTGAETRAESEMRAAKFYLWLVEFLDDMLSNAGDAGDIFDASAIVTGEEGEIEHDKLGTRRRRRRTVVLMGHGDFMCLVLKRIISGFGYAVETEGICHRSGFVHFNTGITELEYFGKGRFLLMSSNATPHISDPHDHSGGGLKDGWKYIIPIDKYFVESEVSIAFADELEDHVKEQTEALKSLYLNKEQQKGGEKEDKMKPQKAFKRRFSFHLDDDDDKNAANDGDPRKSFHSEKQVSRCMLTSASARSSIISNSSETTTSNGNKDLSFVVKRGLQVVGCAWYDRDSGRVKDVVVRPSARGEKMGQQLVEAIKDHAKREGVARFLIVEPEGEDEVTFFKKLGFDEMEEEEEEGEEMGEGCKDMILKMDESRACL